MPLEGPQHLSSLRMPQLEVGSADAPQKENPPTAGEHLPRRRAKNETESTGLVCPSKVWMSCPVFASHSLSVLSALPDRIRAPSGENATELTHECASKVRSSCPVCGTPQLERLVEAARQTRPPSRENATE